MRKRPDSPAVRMKKMRAREAMGLKLIRIVVPERFAPRLKAMAERLTRRHVEKMEGKDDE